MLDGETTGRVLPCVVGLARIPVMFWRFGEFSASRVLLQARPGLGSSMLPLLLGQNMPGLPPSSHQCHLCGPDDSSVLVQDLVVTRAFVQNLPEPSCGRSGPHQAGLRWLRVQVQPGLTVKTIPTLCPTWPFSVKCMSLGPWRSLRHFCLGS